MGGGKTGGDHGHGSHHHHDHHKPRVYNSVINYYIPEPGHHVADFKAPDWKIYKVENAPQLLEVKNRLARVGLKDPWLRNEVWRFDPQFGYLHPRKALIKAGTSGMKYGLVLAIGTIVLETAWNKVFGKDDHSHGHH